MSNKTCYDAFHAAREARRQFPLTQGVYKLREAVSVFREMRETINAIEDLICNRARYPAGSILGSCCTTADKAYWMRSMPIYTAEVLGYVVFPAVEALVGDGHSHHDVRREINSAYRAVGPILQQCDAAHSRIKGRIDLEYRRMKEGRSALRPLLDLVEAIPQRALNSMEGLLLERDRHRRKSTDETIHRPSTC